MMTTRAAIALSLSLAGFAGGCMSFSDRGFEQVTGEIVRQAPALELRKEFAVSLGAVMLNILDVFTVGSRFDFSDVDKVQVAVYGIPRTANLSQLDLERALRARDPTLTWETAVKIRKQQERTWVLVGVDESRNSIAAVSVMVVEQGELVLINVDGELREMLEFAFEPVRGKRGAFSSG